MGSESIAHEAEGRMGSESIAHEAEGRMGYWFGFQSRRFSLLVGYNILA